MYAKVKTGTNQFNALKSDSDDAQVEEEEEVHEIPVDPKSNLGKFQQISKNAKTLPELAKAFDTFIRSFGKSSRTYNNKFDTYDGLTVKEYDDILTARIQCYNDRVPQEVLDDAYSKYSSFKSPDLRSLLVDTIKGLKSKNQNGQGALLLIADVLSREPDLFTKDLLTFEGKELIDAAPALGFIYAYVIQNSAKPPTGKFILRMFCPVFLNPEASLGGLAVCGAHCAMRALRHYHDPRVTAFHFAVIDRLVRDKSTNRATHISQVFDKFSKAMRITRMDKYVSAIITVFDDMPQYRNELLVANAKDSKLFVDGWVEYNKEHEDGVKAFKEVTDQLIYETLYKFPRETIVGDSDNIRLMNKEIQLNKRSVREIILGLVAGAVFVSHYYLELF